MFCAIAIGWLMVPAGAQDAPKPAIAALEKALVSAGDGSSEARQRLAVRRVIRDAEKMLENSGDGADRWAVLEFLFRARQRLITLDDDSKHRRALIETCRQLVKAPDEFAELRLEADLLLSQVEQAKRGANAEDREQALRPFVARYLNTPAGAKVLRIAMVMALELGDPRLVNDLREMIQKRYAADPEMINFQRDTLGGQVFGAPFAGTFQRSDGKTVRFPMDLLGRVSMVVFWSKEGDGLEFVKGLAAAAKEAKGKIGGRMQFFSINLDELPDAGEAIIRKMGVDWPVLHLPGGRDNPIYKAYARADPKMMRVTPTGQIALVMSGVGRERLLPDGTPDFQRLFGSALARGWSREEYAMHLSALMTGDFLVFDPAGTLDPTRPPELKAAAMGGEVKPLKRGAGAVPAATLAAIDDCFVAPPQRYRLTYPQARAGYGKAVELCRKAIAGHPDAPDLWIVRNRLMVALLGLWKTGGDLGQFEAAVAEAKTALDAGYPEGCDLVAHFCLARAALREAGAESGQVIDPFVAERGGENAPGPALAVAALLALDVADRARFVKFRQAILNGHSEYPMMWIFTSFLLDRHHDYWLFQMPFTAGWSYGRRASYFKTTGDIEQAHRLLQTELRTSGGEPLRIPEDLDSRWTMIVFAKPGPWKTKQNADLPPSPDQLLRSFAQFADARPGKDVKVLLALFGGDAEFARSALKEKKVECPLVTVPGGMDNPLIHRLGILAEDQQLNSVLVGKDGRIASVVSGLAWQSGRNGLTLANVVEREDEKFITSLLERGELQAARERILALAPPYDPEAVDERGRKLKKPNHSLAHLRARARVHMALEQWDQALADAETVVQRQLGKDGGMSLRTEALDEAEKLRDAILKRNRRSEESE
jgi:tetratricopeptide (TPR) repeat protein